MSTQQPRMAAPSAKEQILSSYDSEHATTMKVLRAYPADRLDLRPADGCRTARELAWVFVLERGLGESVFNNQLEKLMSGGTPPEPPESWEALLDALESAHQRFGDLIRSTSEEDLQQIVKFFVGPKTMGDYTRIEWIRFLIHDEIHHRGQFSVYLRMAGGRVPSIYGPSKDEPWM